LTPGTQKGGNGSGNGNGKRPPDDFEPFIRDRDDDFAEAGFSDSWDNPRAGYDPYADFARSQAGGGSGSRGFIDRGLIDGIVGILDSLSGVAGDALSPETRDRLNRALRDLLVVLRDVIDAMIRRLDTKLGDDVEIENIPVD
jgi:hypothetical protein